MKKILLSFYFLTFIFSCFLFSPAPTLALSADQVGDCYLKDFQSDIVVNEDSSLFITENILADCGNIPGKHGIFRILNNQFFVTENENYETPVQILTITDFNDNPLKYTIISDKPNETTTLKIGDANKTISGEVQYRIKYKVFNIVRFYNADFDELYLNLNGNFWTMQTEKYKAKITFPAPITANNTETNYYSGAFGAKETNVSGKWISANTIEITSLKLLREKEGITVSVTFPKNIVSPTATIPSDVYPQGTDSTSSPMTTQELVVFLLVLFGIPVIVFIVCFMIWYRNGQDIRLNRSITPEFDIPDKLSPMEFGTFYDNGDLKTSRISAAIIGLATKGIITIEEIPKKGIFDSADTRLIKKATEAEIAKKLTPEEVLLLDKLFGGDSELLLSSLKNKFYKQLPVIKEAAKKRLLEDGLFDKKGFALKDGMVVLATVIMMGAFFGFSFSSFGGILGIAALISGVIILIFGLLMPKRTEKGAELLWRIKGFKLYMTTAEKYRQKYNEKEGIFERFLPYAMIFGITGLWISKMKQIYGEDYFNHYTPIWYVGGFNNGFNIDSFENQLSALSSSMASTISSSPSSSGSGGGGFSGSGGGGGGGGSW